MVTGATEASLLLMHWDGARLQWAVGREGRCLSAGEEVADGAEHAAEVIAQLKGKGLQADEVLWSRRHAPCALVPEPLDGVAAFALEHGFAPTLRSTRSNRFENGLTCWEALEDGVEQAVLKAWPMARVVSGTLAWLEAIHRREQGNADAAVYLDVSPARSFWSRWSGGELRGAMTSAERLPENLLYQVANALHRDHLDPADVRLHLSGEEAPAIRELFHRFFKEASDLKPFRTWEATELQLKHGRWAMLWNLESCAS